MNLSTGPTSQNILVISPHADDEAIGCGGYIALSSAQGAKVTVAVMAAGGVKHRHLTKAADFKVRIAELEDCCNVLGVSAWQVLFPEMDMNLESLLMRDIINAFDRILDEGDFDEIYLPQPSHNQDHRITYEAGLASLRPGGRRTAPTLVATFEGTVNHWRPQELSTGFLYVDISDVIEQKITALETYASQVRPFPHPTSSSAVRSLASMRGMECGVPYAERFRIVRMIRRNGQ